MKNTIGIIGAGIGGMASAIRFAAKGFQVTLFEKNQYPGGKIGEWREKGYRFDTGPTVFTMPHLVDELFFMAGKEPAAYYQYHPLEQSCRYFYEDGTTIDAYADPELFRNEL